MFRKFAFSLGLMALVAQVAPSFAHDEFRVIGTITKQNGKELEVTTKDGRVASMHLDANSEVMQENKKAERKILSVGQYVVANGYGDDWSDMLVIDIKIVPPPAK